MAAANARLISTHLETDSVRQLTFERLDTAGVTWEAGAHVRVSIGDQISTRAYSLLRLPGLRDNEFALGVLLQPQGDGGSRFMHALKEGDLVHVTEPRNDFALAGHAEPAILLAGGIGITPILSMAVALEAEGRSYALHYAGRTAKALAFVSQLRRICGGRLHLHCDDDPATALDIAALLSQAPSGSHVYACGPQGMIEAVRSRATSLGWPDTHVHFELFTALAHVDSDGAFEIVVRSTGDVLAVPADATILETLQKAGYEPLFDCLQGNCGLCQCDVIEGIPDHRDIVLSDAEKASNKVMQICVSRSKTPRLVLDF